MRTAIEIAEDLELECIFDTLEDAANYIKKVQDEAVIEGLQIALKYIDGENTYHAECVGSAGSHTMTVLKRCVEREITELKGGKSL